MDELNTPATEVNDRLAQQRERLRSRHSAALIDLMGARTDLRGVHALADHFDEAVRWTA
jgi:hypothetical protein